MKCVCCIYIVSIAIFIAKADNGNQTLSNTTVESETPREIFEQIVTEQCSRRYSLMCLKLDAIKLVDRLGHSQGYQLLPGVSLVHVNEVDAEQHRLPQEVVASLVEGNVTSLDTFLVRRIRNYVDSLTLSVKMIDSGTVVSAKKLGEKLLYGSSTAVEEGRRKKGGHGHGHDHEGGDHGGGHGAAMWMCGTVAAIGMAGLAAVSGKALMTALLALVLAAAGAMKGGGGGHKCGGHYDSTGRHLPLDTITSSANTLIQLPELKTAFDPVSSTYYQ